MSVITSFGRAEKGKEEKPMTNLKMKILKQKKTLKLLKYQIKKYTKGLKQ